MMPARVALLGVLVAAGLMGCAAPPSAGVAASAPEVPATVVPEQIGDLRFQREPSAEDRLSSVGDNSLLRSVQVFTARNGSNLLGYLEVGEFKPEYPATRPEVRQGVLSSLGGGKPEPVKIGEDVVFAKQGAEQKYIIWFAPGGRYFQVLVASKKLNNPEGLFGAILDAQRGVQVDAETTQVERYDPRRGGTQ